MSVIAEVGSTPMDMSDIETSPRPSKGGSTPKKGSLSLSGSQYINQKQNQRLSTPTPREPISTQINPRRISAPFPSSRESLPSGLREFHSSRNSNFKRVAEVGRVRMSTGEVERESTGSRQSSSCATNGNIGSSMMRIPGLEYIEQTENSSMEVSNEGTQPSKPRIDSSMINTTESPLETTSPLDTTQAIPPSSSKYSSRRTSTAELSRDSIRDSTPLPLYSQKKINVDPSLTFQQLIEGDYLYIDKTPEIMKIENQHTFLIRPPLFGKTLLLSTLQTLFQGKEQLFKETSLGDKSPEFWDLMRHPVLRLRLNFEVDQVSKHAMELAFNKCLSRQNTTEYKIDFTESPNRNIQNMIKCIYGEREGRQVALLIDDYDHSLVSTLLQHPKQPARLRVVNDMLLDNLHGLGESTLRGKRKGMLHCMLVLGRMRMRGSRFHVGCLDDRSGYQGVYSNILGFSSRELCLRRSAVRECIGVIGARRDWKVQRLVAELITYYGGYSFHMGAVPLPQDRLLHPYSILWFLKQNDKLLKLQFCKYWILADKKLRLLLRGGNNNNSNNSYSYSNERVKSQSHKQSQRANKSKRSQREKKSTASPAGYLLCKSYTPTPLQLPSSISVPAPPSHYYLSPSMLYQMGLLAPSMPHSASPLCKLEYPNTEISSTMEGIMEEYIVAKSPSLNLPHYLKNEWMVTYERGLLGVIGKGLGGIGVTSLSGVENYILYLCFVLHRRRMLNTDRVYVVRGDYNYLFDVGTGTGTGAETGGNSNSNSNTYSNTNSNHSNQSNGRAPRAPRAQSRRKMSKRMVIYAYNQVLNNTPTTVFNIIRFGEDKRLVLEDWDIIRGPFLKQERRHVFREILIVGKREEREICNVIIRNIEAITPSDVVREMAGKKIENKEEAEEFRMSIENKLEEVKNEMREYEEAGRTSTSIITAVTPRSSMGRESSNGGDAEHPRESVISSRRKSGGGHQYVRLHKKRQRHAKISERDSRESRGSRESRESRGSRGSRDSHRDSIHSTHTEKRSSVSSASSTPDRIPDMKRRIKKYESIINELEKLESSLREEVFNKKRGAPEGGIDHDGLRGWEGPIDIYDGGILGWEEDDDIEGWVEPDGTKELLPTQGAPGYEKHVYIL